MLRYNNQSGMSKPVDYYRPLTVDVSVEYELPKEVAPPPGSAPLLIIHPSAYFRSKVNQPSSSSHTSSSSPASHKNVPMSSRGSRHDLNPTLYYLNSANSNSNRGTASTSSLVGHHNNQNHLTSNHIKSLRHGSSMSGSITRSRSVAMASSDQQPVRGSLNLNCPYGKYEDYSSGNGGVGGMSASSASLTSSLNNRVSSAMKKVGIHPTERERERLSYSNNYGNGMTQSSTQSSHNGLSMSGNHNLSANVHGSVVSSFAPAVATSSTPMMTTTSSNAAPGLNFGGVVGSTISQSGTVSNKRLRMMNQQQHQNLQQQQQQQQQHQSNLHNPPQQPMEPLNLAITPSASNSLLNPSYHNSIQLSTFFGNNYSNSGGSNKASHGLSNTNSYGNNPNNNINNNSSISSNGSHMTGLGLNYGSTFPNNYRTSNPTTTSQSLYMAQSARFPKECPVPVDKGSGSDSGVCSENDSDVSPPMAPFSGHPRRSILSQELPTTGCYCCCCPTTTSSSSSSSRKNSGLSSSTASTTSSHSKSKSTSLSSSNNSNHQNQNQNLHGNQNQNQNQQNIMMSSQQQYLQHPLGANNSNTIVSSKLSGHHGSHHGQQQHGGGGGHHGLYSSSNNNTNNNLSSSGNTSNSSGSLFNYGMNTLNPTISMNMNMLTMQHDGLLSNSMSTESSSSLSASHLDLDSTYRKWFGSGLGSGLIVDANTSSLGRWFQV